MRAGYKSSCFSSTTPFIFSLNPFRLSFSFSFSLALTFSSTFCYILFPFISVQNHLSALCPFHTEWNLCETTPKNPFTLAFCPFSGFISSPSLFLSLSCSLCTCLDEMISQTILCRQWFSSSRESCVQHVCVCVRMVRVSFPSRSHNTATTLAFLRLDIGLILSFPLMGLPCFKYCFQSHKTPHDIYSLCMPCTECIYPKQIFSSCHCIHIEYGCFCVCMVVLCILYGAVFRAILNEKGGNSISLSRQILRFLRTLL